MHVERPCGQSKEGRRCGELPVDLKGGFVMVEIAQTANKNWRYRTKNEEIRRLEGAWNLLAS